MGRCLLKQILQRVVGMNPFGKSKVDTLKHWSNLVDTDARPVALLALEVLSVPLSGAQWKEFFRRLD
uniref:Uncharacterized protein n=1 Tax=Ditylenchus dipsaci TaxID=166011 RepID=A0A915DQU9_9BILA